MRTSSYGVRVEIRFRTRSGMVSGEDSAGFHPPHDVSSHLNHCLYRPDHCLPTELLLLPQPRIAYLDVCGGIASLKY